MASTQTEQQPELQLKQQFELQVTTICTTGRTVATTTTLTCFVTSCHDNYILEPWFYVSDTYCGKLLWEAATKRSCQTKCPIAIQYWESKTSNCRGIVFQMEWPWGRYTVNTSCNDFCCCCCWFHCAFARSVMFPRCFSVSLKKTTFILQGLFSLFKQLPISCYASFLINSL